MRKELFISTVLFFGLALFGACKKVEAPGGGGGNPQEPDLKRSFQLVLGGLPGETVPRTGLSVLVSITNAQGDTIVKNKRLSLKHDQQYFTDTLLSVKGNYNISKFWILQNNEVLFVTPITGSSRAQAVTAPLPVQVSLVSADHKLQHIEVARVGAYDKSEDFGYAPGEFGKIDPGPVEDPNALISIWVHPLIRIGDVVYDSIPATITVQTWDKAGQMTSRNAVFSAGRNKIDLLRSASKYKFRIEKWGTVDEMELIPAQVQAGAVYVFGGSKQAKKLSEVLTYKIVQGVSTPHTRLLYNYNTDGKIAEILTFKKMADNSNYLALKEKINYDMGRVESISRYDEEAAKTGSTHFSYLADGKLHQMIDYQGGHHISAELSYTAAGGGSGISGDHLVSIKYAYSEHQYTAVSNLSIRGGNMIESLYSATNGDYAKGLYTYDFGINPYIHLKLPDLYLSNYSKHNRTAEQNEYFKAYPIVEAYDYDYTYGTDGYPVELIVKYKTYLTGAHAYDIRTVFKY